MNPRDFERRNLSAQACKGLAQVVLSESQWQQLARQRYLQFLEREGLVEDKGDSELASFRDEFETWRKRLFSLLFGTLTAALILMSLTTVFADLETNPQTTTEVRSTSFDRAIETPLPLKEISAKSCALGQIPRP